MTGHWVVHTATLMIPVGVNIGLFLYSNSVLGCKHTFLSLLSYRSGLYNLTNVINLHNFLPLGASFFPQDF